MVCNLFGKESCCDRPERNGVIISPGALGDNLLMLPLARFMKQSLGLDRVDFIGHTESICFYPGRTCLDRIRSLEQIDFHRLFVAENEFELADKDPLIHAFSSYEWIISFLGAGNPDFESNLFFTVNCSRACEVVFIPLKSDDLTGYISNFYIRRLIDATLQEMEFEGVDPQESSIRPLESDFRIGLETLTAHAIVTSKPLAILHPGSGGAAKCWNLDNFILLAQALGDKGMQVVFLLGPAEQERLSDADKRRLAETGPCIADLDLEHLVQILSCAVLFCGNDSGITHLAAGLGVPTVAIFGPTDPAVYQPLGPRVKVILESLNHFNNRGQSDISPIQEAVEQLLKD
ncbi:MAG: glycosyltransferase family 9 protein [Sedimentisphaerales bacterium]|nr:glycosyltransferase family 9 protein [Sedimentisphaerales bacterium]